MNTAKAASLQKCQIHIFIKEASPLFRLTEPMEVNLTLYFQFEFLWYLLSHYPIPEQESTENSLYTETAINYFSETAYAEYFDGTNPTP